MPDFGLDRGIGTADYTVYIDPADSKYKARNNVTGNIDSTSATDAAVVINACITALTNGGCIQLDSGTFLISTAITITTGIKLRGQGDATVIKQDTTINIDGLIISSLFASLTGTGTSGSSSGPYNVYLQDFKLDGNQANNTTSGFGIKYYGYDWHFINIHITACHGGGLYSEWSDNGICPQSFVCMESFYRGVRIDNCNTGVGWQNRGPHDSQATDVIIHSNFGGYLQQSSATFYDGSLYATQMHIFDVKAGSSLIAADIQGGQLTFSWLTTESTPTGGFGLKTSSTGTVKGNGLWSYLNDTGIQLNTAGNNINGCHVTACVVIGVEVLGNDNNLNGKITGSPINLSIGSGGVQVSDCLFQVVLFGGTTSQLNWPNASNRGINILASIYTDSTHTTAVAGTPDQSSNTLQIENLTDGSSGAVRFIDAKSMQYAQVIKNPFYRKTGSYVVGVTENLYGILSGVTLSGAGTTVFAADSFAGRICTHDTGTTQNSRAGINGAASSMVALTARRLNPSLKAHVKIGTTTTSRFYFGFSSATVLPVTDTPLATTDLGVLVGWRSSDSNFQIFSNNGGGSAETVTQIAGPIAINGNFNTIEVKGNDAGSSFVVILNGTQTVITTTIPAQATALVPYCIVENSALSAARQITIDTLTLDEDFIA